MHSRSAGRASKRARAGQQAPPREPPRARLSSRSGGVTDVRPFRPGCRSRGPADSHGRCGLRTRAGRADTPHAGARTAPRRRAVRARLRAAVAPTARAARHRHPAPAIVRRYHRRHAPGQHTPARRRRAAYDPVMSQRGPSRPTTRPVRTPSSRDAAERQQLVPRAPPATHQAP